MSWIDDTIEQIKEVNRSARAAAASITTSPSGRPPAGAAAVPTGGEPTVSVLAPSSRSPWPIVGIAALGTAALGGLWYAFMGRKRRRR